MTEISLPVTFTVISIFAIMLLILTSWIGIRRGRNLRGDGGDAVLFKRIRIHGNLIENTPAFILILGSSEIAGLSQGWLWLAVLSFAAGRILHYVLFDSPLRGAAMLLILVPGTIMGIWLLSQIYG